MISPFLGEFIRPPNASTVRVGNLEDRAASSRGSSPTPPQPRTTDEPCDAVAVRSVMHYNDVLRA